MFNCRQDGAECRGIALRRIRCTPRGAQADLSSCTLTEGLRRLRIVLRAAVASTTWPGCAIPR